MSQQEPTEEEIRAAMEAQMAEVRVEDVVLQSVVSLVNLGARRAGLAPGTEGERDLVQVKVAIDSARALLPVIEQLAPEQGKAVRDAVSQLQMAYVQAGGDQAAASEAGGGGGPEGSAPAGEAPSESQPEGPGQGQQSGRLWIPGQ
jgi:hypothetical protein